MSDARIVQRGLEQLGIDIEMLRRLSSLPDAALGAEEKGESSPAAEEEPEKPVAKVRAAIRRAVAKKR